MLVIAIKLSYRTRWPGQKKDMCPYDLFGGVYFLCRRVNNYRRINNYRTGTKTKRFITVDSECKAQVTIKRSAIFQ